MTESILSPLDNPITIDYLIKHNFKKFIYSVNLHKIDFTNLNKEDYIDFFENRMYYEYSFDVSRLNFTEWRNVSIIRYWPINFDVPDVFKDYSCAVRKCTDVRGLFTIQRRVADKTQLDFYKIDTTRELEDLITMELYINEL